MRPPILHAGQMEMNPTLPVFYFYNLPVLSYHNTIKRYFTYCHEEVRGSTMAQCPILHGPPEKIHTTQQTPEKMQHLQIQGHLGMEVASGCL